MGCSDHNEAAAMFNSLFPILLMQCCEDTSLESIAGLLADIIGKCNTWVLDIDLDFFSTGNPYRSLFTDVRCKTNF